MADRRQSRHAQAAGFLQEAINKGARIFTSNYILAELTALLTNPLRFPKKKQILFLADIRSSTLVDMVFVNEIREAEAWKMWEARPDKNWTLADCTSFVIMQERGLTNALTTDHHFEQAGLVRLLKWVLTSYRRISSTTRPCTSVSRKSRPA